jgi:cytochrome c oxidase subunit 2
MPIVLHAVSKERYAEWIEEKKAERDEAALGKDMSMEELMAKGAEVYSANCAACHMAQGEGAAGLFPALAGSPIATGPAGEHISKVLEGKNLMPAYKGQLNDVDLAAVITYERNSWGNSTGDMVQASDVKAAR